jgi:hypothetical protein
MVMRELDIVNPDFHKPLQLLTTEDKRQAAYQEFLARLPYRREMEMVLDCNMRVARELPIYLGDSITEILFNLSQEYPITYGHAEGVAVLVCSTKKCGSDWSLTKYMSVDCFTMCGN